MSARTAVVGLVVLLTASALAGMLWKTRPHEPRRSEPLDPARDVTRPAEVLPDEREPLAEPERELQQEARSARQYLSDYWGARWAEIEPAMVAAGLNLDGPFEPVPWEDVAHQAESVFRLSSTKRESEARQILDWPSSEDPAELAKELSARFETREPLADHDAMALDDIAAPFNQQISDLAEEYVEGLDQVLQQRFRDEDFVKAPFATYGVAKPEDMGEFFAVFGAVPGWGLLAGLKRSDYPYLMDVRDRARELVAQRDLEERRYLGQQGYISFHEKSSR